MELKQMTPAEFSAVYQERMTADFPADELRPLSSMKDLHAQGNYLDGPLYDDNGIPRYKLDRGRVVERTEEEIAADLAAMPAPPPTREEILEAKILELQQQLLKLQTGG